MSGKYRRTSTTKITVPILNKQSYCHFQWLVEIRSDIFIITIELLQKFFLNRFHRYRIVHQLRLTDTIFTIWWRSGVEKRETPILLFSATTWLNSKKSRRSNIVFFARNLVTLKSLSFELPGGHSNEDKILNFEISKSIFASLLRG